MSIFAINSNNGFLVTGGQLNIVSDLDAVVINCQHAAQELRGEDPFRQGAGMPNLKKGGIWDGSPDVLTFEADLRGVLSVVNNVDSLSEFEATVVDNELDYSIKIHTPFGTETISGSV